METNLKRVVENMRLAQKALVVGKEKLQKLEEKKLLQQESIPGLLRVMEKAEVIKKKAFDAYVAESISRGELDEAREAFGKAGQAYIEANEMLEAIVRACNEAAAEIPRLSDAFVFARKKVWVFIMEDMRTKIQAAVGEDMVKAWGAAQMCGAEFFSHFARTIFTLPPQAAMRGIIENLEKEYLLRAGVE